MKWKISLFLLVSESVYASDFSAIAGLVIPYLIGALLLVLIVVSVLSWVLSNKIKDYEQRMMVRFLPTPLVLLLSAFYFGFHFILVVPIVLAVLILVVRFSFGGYKRY